MHPSKCERDVYMCVVIIIVIITLMVNCSLVLFCRLVMSDVAYYTTSLRALPGLADLDVGVDDIWDDS